MAKVRRAEEHEGDSGHKKYAFQCPACGKEHVINDTWEYNNDPSNPTISPSILATGYHREYGGKDYRCHSYVKNGSIEFLGDCTHNLKNQTVELPEYKSDPDQK